MNSTTQTHAIDQTLQLLADQHRRTVLLHLMENGKEPIALDELVREMRERNLGRGDGQREPPRRIATQLHHVHLPKLANGGLVEYDSRSKTVRYQSDTLAEAVLQALVAFE